MIATWQNIHPQALAAIRCAANWNIWGRHAAVAYARKHNCLRLAVLARQLQTATLNGF